MSFALTNEIIQGKNWLIVFDNAENQKIVANLWPPTSHGSVLLTSQNQNWASADNLSRLITVGSFSPADGLGMLQEILQNDGSSISYSEAKRIVSVVGALPLAIFQIGSYMKATRSSPNNFFRQYEKPSGAAKVDSWDEATPLTYQHTLATVWKLAFEKLSSDSILLLNVLSFLDSDHIPDALFLEAPTGTHFDDYDV